MKKSMFRSLFAFVILLFVCSSTQAAFAPPDHYTVSYKLLYTYTKDSLARHWKKHHIPQIMVPIRNDVDMYEVTYKGIWLDSTFIMAKGVMYVAKNNKPAAEMVYCHGTRISLNQDYGIQDLEQFVPIMHAADGYIGLFPFYYGLGGGEKEHVYQDSYTEAMSTIYMIKACREIYPKIGETTTGQLFVTGYSQGGHAAMATAKYLDSGQFPDIKLTAASPMSGAYDMVGVQAKTMFQKYDQPHYLPYLLISYQYAYHLWPGSIYDVFKPPYNTTLQKVFAQPRIVDYGDVNAMLPKIPKDMIVDSLVGVFNGDTSFAFRKKLKENCLNEWVPTTPLQMCACYADNEVMCDNTIETYNYMKARTKNVVYKHVFGKHLSHNPCAPFAIIYSKIFFDNFRKGRKNVAHVPAGKQMLLDIAIAQANQQAKRHMKKFGKVESDALAGREKKK